MKDNIITTQKYLSPEHYIDQYSLCNFVNAYYQIRDCMDYHPTTVLIVGIGFGLESIILKEKFGIAVSTLDVDPGFNVDYVGSVNNMNMVGNKQFDVCIVSHVLEHLQFQDFEPSLREISRIAKHALIYLPYGSRHLELRFIRAQHEKEYSIKCTIPRFKKIDGTKPELCGNQHYWECGYRKFEIDTIKRILRKYFTVDKMYHNRDWQYSMNYCLTSKGQ